jgi:hypothetical protein
MPKYYFHIKRGQVTILDHQGIELADIEEAAKEASRLGREIAANQARDGIPPAGGMIIIDEGWRTVLELPFDSTDR